MSFRHRIYLKNITIILLVLLITRFIPTRWQSEDRKSITTVSTSLWAIQFRAEVQNELSIWCVENLERSILEKQLYHKRIYYAPSTIAHRRERLPYSYLKWKESNVLPRQLTPCEHVIIMRLLTIVADICIEQQIQFLMIGGTLLGSWRHHDIIPWDEDADLLMPAKDQQRFIEALKLLKGSTVHYTLLPFSERPDRSFKVFFRNTPCTGSHCSWKFPSVDLVVYDSNASHLWFSDNPSVQIPLHYVFPYVMRPLSYLWLPAPRVAQKILPANFDIECTRHSYDHRFEREQIGKKYNCSDFVDTYPFVRRTEHNNLVEKLVIGDNMVHTVIYPSSNITIQNKPETMIKQP